MNLIFGAFASLEGYREGDGENRGGTLYYRCAVVALASAKCQNPADTVALVTNAAVPAPYRDQLTAAGVELWQCPFDSYRVEAGLEWSLAFYKLCAMEWVLQNKPFAAYALVDLDTYTQRPYADLWRESAEAVLLYQVPHAASQSMAAAISANYNAVYGGSHILTHFGGELLCGSAARLSEFMDRCRSVYGAMIEKGVKPHEGDEFITCAAAYQSQRAGSPVRSASAYIFRYWLGARFYFVSTNYCQDPVCILHLPGNGKNRQLAVLYRRYIRNGCFPPDKTVWALCCLPPAHPPLWRSVWVRLLARLQ